MKFYKGDYKKDALSSSHWGWIVGTFMEERPRKTDKMEIKYWEFEIGPADHANKISKTLECTIILEGKMTGEIDGQKITLEAGDYVVIKPNTPNGFPQNVSEKARGITIKAPSDPKAKKIVGS